MMTSVEEETAQSHGDARLKVRTSAQYRMLLLSKEDMSTRLGSQEGDRPRREGSNHYSTNDKHPRAVGTPLAWLQKCFKTLSTN